MYFDLAISHWVDAFRRTIAIVTRLAPRTFYLAGVTGTTTGRENRQDGLVQVEDIFDGTSLTRQVSFVVRRTESKDGVLRYSVAAS